MSREIRTLAVVLVTALAVGVSVLSWPLQAAENLNILQKFRSANLELAVATYLDPKVAPPKNKVGLLGLASGSQRNSFAFKPAEWTSLINLWAKAVKAQSSPPSTTWTVVGEMSETETSDISHLILSAGPGARFVVASPKGAGITYVLAKADFGRFEKGLSQVKDFLSK